MDAGALDAWLPRPAVRTHHQRSAGVGPDALWEAAGAVRLDEARTLGHLVRWRIPGTPGGLTFRELFASYPFVVLDEGPDWSMSGLCGRIWTLHRDYPRLSGPDEFRAWRDPATVRVLFAHWVEPGPDGGSTLHSEARVSATDRRGDLRLRSLWPLIRAFERLIGAEPLPLAVARAERASARPARARS